MNLVELVPRDLQALRIEARQLQEKFGFLDGFNIPDVLRLENRSHDAARQLLEDGLLAIPHVRTMDRGVEATLELVDGLDRVLFITGDGDAPGPRPVEVVAAARERFPELKIYCGLDPYRQSLKSELNYCDEKIAAGADGFFTQPFFDKNLARVYMDQLQGAEVFLGLSPVTSERSLEYWITRNHAVFPSDFSIDEEANFRVGRELVALAEEYAQHCYLMPIKYPAEKYVEGVFEKIPMQV